MTVSLSWAVVNTGAAFADAACGVQMLTAKPEIDPEVSAAIQVKAALGPKYKERSNGGLESTLDYLIQTGSD